MGYKNKILVSHGTFSLGKNSEVNTLELAEISNKVVVQPTSTHKTLEQEQTNTQTITHKNEKIALILFLAGGYMIWNMFQ